MTSTALKGGLVLAVAFLLFGCGNGYRGPRSSGGDSSVTIDGSADGSFDGGVGDTAVGDGAVADTSVSTDGSTTGDGSTTAPGQCEPSCLDTPGAVCCMTCGSCGEVDCTPVCSDGQVWDCELLTCR